MIIRPRSLRPSEGWLSLVFMALVCLTMAWAIADARWILGNPTHTAFLPLATIGGVVAGFVGAKVGWGRWTTFAVGSLVAAVVLPIVVGGVLLPNGTLQQRFTATASSTVVAWRDLFILNKPFTQQFGHYMLTLAIFVWATAMFATYAAYGHRRPLTGILAIGFVLVGNMALTANDQLPLLVVYSLAALFALVRFHVFDEQRDWMRRRIGDPTAIGSIYQRGGALFIAITVGGSLLLTKTAASDPLAGAWNDFGDQIIDVSRSLQRYLPGGGTNRSFGVSFGDTAPISGVWVTDAAPAAVIQLPADEERLFYWRAVSFDHFEGSAWSRGQTTSVERRAGEELLKGTADAPSAASRQPVAFSVTPQGFRDPSILSPQSPLQASIPTRLALLGDQQGYFSEIDREGARGAYNATALVPVIGEKDGEINENALRVAGTDYPDAVESIYLQIAPGTLGPDARALVQEMADAAPDRNPYDIAKTMVEQFHDTAKFKYSTDVRGFDCDAQGLSTVECFARYREGYCQHYATTMAIFLRSLGIPARVAMGFLPGDRNNAGLEQLLLSNAHAWVEVYFPGYGWVDFDPTGNNLSRLATLPAGPQQSARPSLGSFAPIVTIPPAGDIDVPDRTAGLAPTGPSGPPPGLLVAVALLLATVVAAIAFVAYRRGPRGAADPDEAYGMVTRLAGRFGFGPRPTQTVYEYAGALGEVLPIARPELETVARAKVEVAYGHVSLGQDRLLALREARRRLRVGLLRLALVRARRGRRRRA
ncbi:MAG: DUF3488 and DUF4129 domain-containing transglutaminase family protein [Chloroflexota bacterium]